MSFNLTTLPKCLAKAGANANLAYSMSGNNISAWCDDAEAQLSAITKKDWVTDYSSVKANFRGILSDAVSDLVGIKIISYDPSGFTKQIEAQTIMDSLRDNFDRCVKTLLDDDTRKKMVS